VVLPESLQAASNAVGEAYEALNRLAGARNAQARSAEALDAGMTRLDGLAGMHDRLKSLAGILGSVLSQLGQAHDTQSFIAAGAPEIAPHYVRTCDEAMGWLFGWADAFFEKGGSETEARMQAALPGDYECRDYDGTSGKNDWHYISVSMLSGHSALWRNRAGVSWVLSLTPDDQRLAIGSDCPYYSDYKEARVHWAGAGVTGISGPYGELYQKV
jgi:hypothetical protein